MEPASYTFPPEDNPFASRPYTDRAKEITRNTIADLGRINGRAAALCLSSFIAIFSIGFICAAIVDQGMENWANVNLAYQED